ncbi:Aromatic peroxygenase [Mycena kentingensis (nom. inval.)]|nr:Aromatic peroxygenase [Mycena kentingensis (nom. inval.)]
MTSPSRTTTYCMTLEAASALLGQPVAPYIYLEQRAFRHIACPRASIRSPMRFQLALLQLIGALRAASFPGAAFRGAASPERDSTAHRYIPAGPNDMRGPCVGLNLLANHGYIPRNGIAPLLQSVLATVNVFGIGPDITLVAMLLSLWGANLIELNVSIGGPQPSVVDQLIGGILHRPVGLNGTHNQFESDSSATRCDLAECYDNSSVNEAAFAALIELFRDAPPGTDYRDILNQHRKNRWEHSVATNPYFFYGPIDMIVSCITHELILSLADFSDPSLPQGRLDEGILASMYGMHPVPTPDGGPVRYKYLYGTERLPDNWKRRPDTYLYATHGLPDLLRLWTTYPETLLVGGNLGRVNSFAPLSIADFTGGRYTIETLLQQDNAACFAFQLAQVVFVGELATIEKIAASLFAELQRLVGLNNLQLACPELEAFKLEMLDGYPGYRRRYG